MDRWVELHRFGVALGVEEQLIPVLVLVTLVAVGRGAVPDPHVQERRLVAGLGDGEYSWVRRVA